MLCVIQLFGQERRIPRSIVVFVPEQEQRSIRLYIQKSAFLRCRKTDFQGTLADGKLEFVLPQYFKQ